MTSTARHEVEIVLAGKTFSVGLNLGALSYVEEKMHVTSFEAALDAQATSASALIELLRLLLEGNGIAITDEILSDLKRWSVSEASDFIMSLMNPPGGKSASKLSPRQSKGKS